MTTTEKLQTLVSTCKAGVHIDFNDHRSYYQTPEDHIKDFGDGNEKDDIDPEVWNKIVELNELVEIQFYPQTANGFFKIRHYDFDLALDQCIEILKQEEML